MTKIYDCFTFYNEFDLLELRLKELYDHVDYFVLVEANKTFQNKDKPFYFKEQAADPRWIPYLDKLTLIAVSDMPQDTDTWGRERHQRDAIMYACADADPDDIIMIGDVDEIPRPETVDRLRTSSCDVFGFRMPLFNFKLNYMLVTQDMYHVWSGAVRKFAMTTPEDFRRQRHALQSFPYNYDDGSIAIMEHAGWHFTYFGNEEFARNKLQSFSHTEENVPTTLDQIDIADSIAQGKGIRKFDDKFRFKLVAIDDYMPATVIGNLDHYSQFTVPTDNASALDLLPKA